MNVLKQRIGKILSQPWVQFVLEVFQRFGRDNGGLYAAGLAFFVLLALVPIILTSVAVVSCFVNVHETSIKMTDLIRSFFPAGGARAEVVQLLTNQFHIEDQVRGVIRDRGLAGIIGFLSLIWAAMQIFLNAASAMNSMWEARETRNFFMQRIVVFLLMIVTGGIVGLSLLLSTVTPAMTRFHVPILSHLHPPIGIVTVVCETLALLLNTFMYVFLYKVLPNATVTWKAAGIGGTIASLLFELAKKGMASYLLRANHSVYGDLANLILFLLWIYYSMMILLLGAEVAACIGRLEEGLNHASPRVQAHPVQPVTQHKHRLRDPEQRWGRPQRFNAIRIASKSKFRVS
jgi:membrane protein